MKKTAAEQLADLWDVMKAEGNCKDYLTEMMEQIRLLGTETATATKLMVRQMVEETLDQINPDKYFLFGAEACMIYKEGIDALVAAIEEDSTGYGTFAGKEGSQPFIAELSDWDDYCTISEEDYYKLMDI